MDLTLARSPRVLICTEEEGTRRWGAPMTSLNRWIEEDWWIGDDATVWKCEKGSGTKTRRKGYELFVKSFHGRGWEGVRERKGNGNRIAKIRARFFHTKKYPTSIHFEIFSFSFFKVNFIFRISLRKNKFNSILSALNYS